MENLSLSSLGACAKRILWGVTSTRHPQGALHGARRACGVCAHERAWAWCTLDAVKPFAMTVPPMPARAPARAIAMGGAPVIGAFGVFVASELRAASAASSRSPGLAQRKSRLAMNQAASQMVPRRGLEPPRSYPLVPETSASTNSATWAGTCLLPPTTRFVCSTNLLSASAKT